MPLPRAVLPLEINDGANNTLLTLSFSLASTLPAASPRAEGGSAVPGSTLPAATFWGFLRRGGSGEGQLGVTAALGQLLGAAGPEGPLQTSVPGRWHLALCPLRGEAGPAGQNTQKSVSGGA